jgi:hypothetical protein
MYSRDWLRTQIKAFIHDANTGLEDTFIDVGAIKLGQMLESRENQVTSNVNITESEHAVPAEWVSINLVEYPADSTMYALLSVPKHNLANYGNTGMPAVYNMLGGVLRIAPFVGGTYQVTRFEKVTIPADDAGTNGALEANPQVFLSAALIEAFDYKQDAGMVQRYSVKLENEVRQINLATRRLNRGDAPSQRAV